MDKLTTWRHTIGNTGIMALQMKVFPNLSRNALDFTATEAKVRSKWCTWAILRMDRDHLFYFADVTEDMDGNIESQSVLW